MNVPHKSEIEYYNNVNVQWENLINRRPVCADGLRPEILAVWQELFDSGIDPYHYIPHCVPDTEFRRRLRENAQMCEIAMPFLKNLYDNIPFAYSTFTLTDKDGVPLIGFHVTENAEYVNFLHAQHLNEGIAPECMLAYAPEIILCLRMKKPVWCCADENYLAVSKDWSCVAAPIFDKNNNIIGTISMSDKTQHSTPHSMGIVTSAAKAITNEIKLLNANDQLKRTTSQLTAAIESTPLGMMVVDNNGIISHANNHLIKMLFFNQTHSSSIIGKHVSEILIEENGVLPEWPWTSFSERELLLKTPRGFKRYYISSETFSNESTNRTSWAMVTLKAHEYIHTFTKNLSSSHAYYEFSDIVGASTALTQQIDLGKIAAKSNSTVLITGPSGTGKELFAQSIHTASDRASGPFISINCGALPSGLVESELFGYEGGAFTGAKKNGQVGKFELANNGTLFLDEIGEMPLSVQASILRVLETREVTRIGGTKTIHIDVRIIAATNKDLLTAVKEKEFREDLYYRLNVLRLTIPPLHTRKEDITALADTFLHNYCKQLQKENIVFTPDAYKALTSYDWPGNVRELENIIERAVNITESNSEITSKHIGIFIPCECISNETPRFDSDDDSSPQIKEMEKDLIIKVLTESKGSIAKSAEIIGIGRRTLYRKCDKYEIDYTQFRSGE